MALSRRGFISAAAGAAALPLASACGFTGSSGGSSSTKDTLTFTTWGTDSELAGLRKVIAGFEKAHTKATVKLNAVPYDQIYDDIDAQIQAGKAPDLFRVPYYTLGSYAGRGQLLDISSKLPSGFASRFTPAAWAAVQSNGHPVGVPHHTDTSVIYYNKKLLHTAGIDAVPTSLDQAWTWAQFTDVATKLRSALPSSKFPVAVNWQGNGVTRWLTWLFEANGRFLSPDGKSAVIDSSAGKAAVDFTKSFFSRKFVPPNTSVKSTSLAADIWYRQTAALGFGGAFQIPDAVSTADFDWGVTFAPRDLRAGSDFGGNAVVVTAKTKKADLAVQFLDYLTRAEQMREFCETASLLPTRRDLVSGGIKFTQRGELTPVFQGQASTVRATDAAQVASPSMLKIITVLQNQLDAAFVGGQSTQATLQGMTSGISTALRK